MSFAPAAEPGGRAGPGAIRFSTYCHRAGPRKFLADVIEQIAEVALAPPRELIGMSVWSLPKLRDYLVAQKVVPSISVERLRQVLHDRGVRWRHSKTWKDSTDPQF